MNISLTKDNWRFAVINTALIVLFILGAIHQCKQKEENDNSLPTPDTIISYLETHDTIYAKPSVKIKYKNDTVWITEKEYVPDTNYKELLGQYKALGDRLFAENTYSTKFSLDSLGSITVIDTVKSNELKGSKLIRDIRIPEKTIIITKQSPKTRQLYVGTGITGRDIKFSPSGATGNLGLQTGLLYKDKKDRIFNVNVGYDGHINYSLNSFWKIKFK